jgi:hypothetical protein
MDKKEITELHKVTAAAAASHHNHQTIGLILITPLKHTPHGNHCHNHGSLPLMVP